MGQRSGIPRYSEEFRSISRNSEVFFEGFRGILRYSEVFFDEFLIDKSIMPNIYVCNTTECTPGGTTSKVNVIGSDEWPPEPVLDQFV